MKSKEEQIQELQDIRNLMEKSSRFLSLSGLSSVFAGIVALAGAIVAYFVILENGSIKFDEHLRLIIYDSGAKGYLRQLNELRIELIGLAFLILLIASLAAYYFSYKKARKMQQKFWSKTTYRIIYNFSLPLIVGAIFTVLLIYQNNVHLVASSTLIFYGLALINASKFTFNEIHFLGISEIILGIFAGIILNYGILFWAMGFGVLHIIYGVVIYFKYEK